MKLEILGWQASVTSPDDDGDCRLSAQATLEFSGEGVVDRLDILHVVRDAAGLPVLVDRAWDASEYYPGDTAQVSTSTYHRGDAFDDCVSSIEVVASVLTTTQLGEALLPQAGERCGQGEPFEVAPGLTCAGWSLLATGPDSDGDFVLTLLCALRNDRDTAVREAEVQASLLKRNGETLDEASGSEKNLAPHSTTVLEGRAYVKERVFGRETKVRLTLRISEVVGTLAAPPTPLELTAR